MLQQAVEWQRVGPQPELRQLLSCSSSVCIADERLDVAPVLQPQCALTSRWTMPQLPGERPRLAPCLESLAVHGEQPAALRAALHGTLLVLVGDSINSALHNALMRFLGNALVLRGKCAGAVDGRLRDCAGLDMKPGFIDEMEAESNRWASRFTHAIIDRVRAVNATASSETARLHSLYLHRLHGLGDAYLRALVLPSPLNMTLAFVNDAHHFAKGKVAPTHVRYRWVSDLVLPALPTLFRDGERRLVVVLNDGMVENVQGNDDARAASNALTESTAAMTSAFLTLQDEVAPTAEMLLVESPPQHFDTPTGLYRPGDRRLLTAACRGAIDGADAANGTALLANFRNVAKIAGATRALRERNANADERGIRVVRQWQALALLSGAAAHGRPNGSSFEEPKRKPDARDCTHSSPDSMVYQLQAFFAALLGGESRIGST